MRARKRLRKASDDVVTHCNDTSTHGEPPQRDHEIRRGSSSRDSDKDGYVQVELAEIAEKVQCLICLGVIRNTRAIRECLHRFCQECIDEYLLLGSNECPACRVHCGSNSLRADPRYDALIEAFYPDVGKSKELAIHEEKMTWKKQFQAKKKRWVNVQLSTGVGSTYPQMRVESSNVYADQGEPEEILGAGGEPTQSALEDNTGMPNISTTQEQRAEGDAEVHAEALTAVGPQKSWVHAEALTEEILGAGGEPTQSALEDNTNMPNISTTQEQRAEGDAEVHAEALTAVGPQLADLVGEVVKLKQQIEGLNSTIQQCISGLSNLDCFIIIPTQNPFCTHTQQTHPRQTP